MKAASQLSALPSYTSNWWEKTLHLKFSALGNCRCDSENFLKVDDNYYVKPKVKNSDSKLVLLAYMIFLDKRQTYNNINWKITSKYIYTKETKFERKCGFCLRVRQWLIDHWAQKPEATKSSTRDVEVCTALLKYTP